MPLLPEIALAAKAPQVAAPDWPKLAYTLAELQNAQSQAYLRQLQGAQIAETLRQYRGLGEFLQSRAAAGQGTPPAAAAPV